MILKHRDTEVLRFDWLEPDGVRVRSVNESARQFLPLDMHGEATDESLWRWIKHRTVPRNRAYIHQFLANLGIPNDSLRAIVEFSRGLSLNDVHWVAGDNDSAVWSDINLYDNPFSETLAYMAFTGGDGSVVPGSSSPELTTNGMLAKCWRRIDGQPVLFKSGTEGTANSGFEPYSEFYAAQIAEVLQLPHVPYDLAKFKGRLCSTCPAFTNKHVGYISAGRLGSRETALADSRFADIFLFDALICNPDRHLGNFGYLVDHDTNTIIGAAPIFDNGYGLFSLALYKNKYKDEFADLPAFASARTPALYSPWLNFPSGITDEMRARVKLLKGFRFTRHPHYNLPTERLRLLEDFLQKRIAEISSNSAATREISVISPSSCIVNHKNESQSCIVNHNNDADIAPKILENLKADPFITQAELADLLGVSPRTIANHLRKLRLAGKIQHVGPAKTGHWEIMEDLG